MKTQLIIASALTVFLFASCKDTEKEMPVEPSIEANASPEAQVDEHAGHNHGTQSNSIAGLNPEHGQPGHRCDIPVGAPLDTPMQNNASAAPAVQPASNNGGPFLVNDQAKERIQKENGATAVPQGTGKINPPHGQPGHVCG